MSTRIILVSEVTETELAAFLPYKSIAIRQLFRKASERQEASGRSVKKHGRVHEAPLLPEDLDAVNSY